MYNICLHTLTDLFKSTPLFLSPVLYFLVGVFRQCFSLSRYTVHLFCPPAVPAKQLKGYDSNGLGNSVLDQGGVEKIPFNIFTDEIWTGELNYSPVCAIPCDDNIVPSRPETQNTKRYFCRVGNCQRNPPLSCLCMHKEHQRLVSDPQMDDLNVTLASKAEQQRNPQNSQRRQLPVLPPPPPPPKTSLSPIPLLYLFVCLSIVALSLWFSYLTPPLSRFFVPLPLSLTLPFSHSLSLTHTQHLFFAPFLSHDLH